MAVCAVRAADLASESCARPRWPRKAGSAIAARMPMMRMTTRSSIRVKPFSLWARSRSLWSMWVNPPEGIVGPIGFLRQVLGPIAPRSFDPWWQPGRLIQSPVALRLALTDGLPLTPWLASRDIGSFARTLYAFRHLGRRLPAGAEGYAQRAMMGRRLL